MSEETVGGATGACTVIEKVRELLLALAVSVEPVSCVTEPPVALNVPELAPEEIEIDDGVVTAELLLDKATESDPLGTTLSRVTVQVVDCPFDSVLAPQERDETTGGDAGALSVTENVREVLLALAVTTAVAVELTAELALAVKVAELDPEATVTDDGTESDELLSDRATDCPPLGAAALKFTVQVALPGGVHDEGLQVRFVNVGKAA